MTISYYMFNDKYQFFDHGMDYMNPYKVISKTVALKGFHDEVSYVAAFFDEFVWTDRVI